MLNYDELIKDTINRGRKVHVFVVDKYSLPVHVNRLFAAVKYPRSEKGFSGRWGLISCLKVLREDDYVLFYQRRIDEPYGKWGFRGIFRVAGEPYLDTEDVTWQEAELSETFKILGKCPNRVKNSDSSNSICGSLYPEKFEFDKKEKRFKFKCSECGGVLDGHILPYRVPIKPVEYLDGVITDNRAYIDRTLPGNLWTMLFRKVYGKGRERSVTVILPEEGVRLFRAFEAEELSPVPGYSPRAYLPEKKHPIKVDLQEKNNGAVKYEHILQAWISENVDQPRNGLEDVLGDDNEIEWFGNEILYGIGGDKVDFLVLHKQNGVRYRATVIELKRDQVNPADVQQVERYAYWVAQLVTANTDLINQTNEISNELTLQPVLIGHRFSKGAAREIRAYRQREMKIEYPKGITRVVVEPPMGVKYEVSDSQISFHIEVKGGTYLFT